MLEIGRYGANHQDCVSTDPYYTIYKQLYHLIVQNP